jgi:methyl-accepting chemotaxis protein
MIGIFGAGQLGLVNNQVDKIVNFNLEQVNTITDSQKSLKDQIILIDDLLLGENVTLEEFNNQVTDLDKLIENLTLLTKGTSIGNEILSLKTSITQLKSATTGSEGFFNKIDNLNALKTLLEKQNFLLDDIHDNFTELFDFLETTLEQLAGQKGQITNITLLQSVNNIDLEIWDALEIPNDALKYNIPITSDNIEEFTLIIVTIQDQIDYCENLFDLELSLNNINQTMYDAVNGLYLSVLSETNPNSFLYVINNTNNGVFRLINDYHDAETQSIQVKNNVEDISNKIVANLDTINDWVSKEMDLQVNATHDQYNLSVLLLIGSVIISIVLAIVLTFVITRNIAPSLAKLTNINEQLSKGDLRYQNDFLETKRTDEIGSLLKSSKIFVSNLKNIIISIQDATSILSSSSEQIASSSEETNASSEAISSISQLIAKNSQSQANLVSVTLRQSEGLKKDFEKKISEISQTSLLIDSISSQINMLALNASIEAARAGEYGRGFSVVAENIRRLADTTKESVQQVQATIENLKSSIIISINDIARSIDELSGLTEEASALTEEQAASLEELTATTQQLTTIAQNLETIVKQFII